MKRSLAVTLALCFLATPLGVRAAAPPAASSTHQQLSKLRWRDIGPYNGGRVVAVAGVPTRPNEFYMGGVQGGVWRTDDAGMTWENISDGKLPQTASSIGAIAVAPSNPRVIYVGTGESDIRGDMATGVGIFKSTDGGTTWSYAGLRDTHTTMALAIDPRNPNVVYAGSMGHVFAPNAERGVFKTTDGGKTWKKILYVNSSTGANSVVMDPSNPNVLYVTMWQAQRTPWNLTSGGPGSGVYKTTDGGAHWTKISAHPGFAAGMLGKMGVALAPSDPRIVYAIVQARHGGVFRSENGGATWTRVNGEMKLRQRAFYYMALTVDPKNANVLYAPEVDSVWKSTDGGKVWKPLTQPGDHHILWINPRDTRYMVEGDDGGATVSVNGGKTWSDESVEPLAQFYHITLDDRFPYHVYGAQQDQGAYEGPSASSRGLTQGAWHSVALGESTFVAVDPRDPHTTFGSGYYSSLVRLDDRTGEEKNVSPWPLYMSGSAPRDLKYRFGWTHPILFSPAQPNVLFETAQVVFKSTDFGQTWSVISPDLTRNDVKTEGYSGGPVDHDMSGAEVFPDIASFAVSPLSGDVMWAGSADGLVHVTTDGGGTWKLVTPPALPQWAQISSIEPSHTEKGTAFLTASRYMWDDFHPYVYETTDYGAHWTAITTGLPSDQYVFAVRQDPRDPRVLVAGTRSTVYVSLDGGARWQPLTLNLPGVQVRDLAFSARQGEIAIATHGRGFWILDNLSLLEQLAAHGARMLYAPETVWLSHAYGGYTPANGGENPAYGATVFFDIPHGYNGKTPVTLAFEDAAGKTVRGFTLHLKDAHAKKIADDVVQGWSEERQMAYALHAQTAIEPGMNAFQWDLRYAPATEVRGLHIETTDDFSDELRGPTIVPGSYTAVLSYGKTVRKVPFTVKLDPRLHPAPGALDARLALATTLSQTLDRLNRTINAALAARAHLPHAKRAQIDATVASIVQFHIHSSEGDLMREVKLRDYLTFVMNELDLAYQAPTPAEQTIASELIAKANAAIAALDASMR